MSPSPEFSKGTLRILLVAALALLVAGVASAATYEDDDGPSEDLAAGDSDDTDGSDNTTTTAPDGDPPGTTPGEVPDTQTGDEGEDPSVTTAAPAETTAPPQTTTPTTQATGGGPDAAPTTAGTYTYDVTGSSSFNGDTEQIDGTATLTVSSVDANGRQTQVTDSRDENGEGSLTTVTYRYAPEGTYLESLKLETTIQTPLGKVNDNRLLTATKPFLIIPTGAGPGTETTGRLQGDDITADITFTIQSVEGDRSTAKLVADLTGDVEGRQESTIIARTSDRLPLRSDDTSDVTAMGFRIQSDTTSILRQ